MIRTSIGGPGLTFAALASISTVVAYLGYKDYKAWLSLGPGGLPHNLVGYFTTSFMKLFAIRNPRDFTSVSGDSHGVAKYLSPDDIPYREGDYPIVAPWPVPNRVLNQFAPDEFKIEAHQAIYAVKDIVLANGKHLPVKVAMSFLEKHSDALFAREVLIEFEAAHQHPLDGSIHINLHPSDARLLIERRWGELHPFAGKVKVIPAGFILLYPPRNRLELDLVNEFIRASVQYLADNQC
ncbi:hypothetical protein V1525DRAFT_397969 [Lipomyces kononenkoae]|uniref:Uncharacterized protein n=1 Tax=Lipomyces kononenkoae TaxID=34357 RepID=A0ACC3T6Q2_LIPKO